MTDRSQHVPYIKLPDSSTTEAPTIEAPKTPEAKTRAKTEESNTTTQESLAKANSITSPDEHFYMLSPRGNRGWPVARRISVACTAAHALQELPRLSADHLDSVARETIKAPPPTYVDAKLPVLTSAFSPCGRWLAAGHGPLKPNKDGTRGELRLYAIKNGYQEPALQEAIDDLAGECH